MQRFELVHQCTAVPKLYNVAAAGDSVSIRSRNRLLLFCAIVIVPLSVTPDPAVTVIVSAAPAVFRIVNSILDPALQLGRAAISCAAVGVTSLRAAPFVFRRISCPSTCAAEYVTLPAVPIVEGFVNVPTGLSVAITPPRFEKLMLPPYAGASMPAKLFQSVRICDCKSISAIVHVDVFVASSYVVALTTLTP